MDLKDVYSDPRTVTSPKNRIDRDSIEVLYDGGAGSWSLVKLIWDGDKRVAMRWNGRASEDKAGNPQSRGMPTWFIIPESAGKIIVDHLDEIKKEEDSLRKKADENDR